MRAPMQILLSLLFVLSPPGLLVAGTIYVPDDWPAIQDAIGDASDTIIVRPDTYVGPGNLNLDFGGRATTLRSEAGVEATIIDCEGGGVASY
jgi:hypothetical protein